MQVGLLRSHGRLLRIISACDRMKLQTFFDAAHLLMLRASLDRTRAAAASGGGPPAPVRATAQPAPGRRRDLPPLRRRQRLLPAGPRAVDGLLLRRLGGRDRRAWTPPRRPSSTWSAASSASAPGIRLLDVGCGWGSLAMHAARRYGVDVVGITLSAGAGRRWPASGSPRPGSTGRIDIRVQDYRDVDDGPFDAISSIGMAEHVGRAKHARLRRRPSHACCGPAGGCSTTPSPGPPATTTWDDDTFIARYVFPDGELLTLGDMVNAADRGRPRGDRRRGAAPALRADPAGVGAQPRGALGRRRGGSRSEGRARVWRLYMAASALSFEAGKLGVEPGPPAAAGRRRRRRCAARLDLTVRRGRKPLSPRAVTVVESPIRPAPACAPRIGPRPGRGTNACE